MENRAVLTTFAIYGCFEISPRFHRRETDFVFAGYGEEEY